MSDQQVPAGAPDPGAATDPATPAQQPAAAPAAPKPPDAAPSPDEHPAWLPGRLKDARASERKQILSDLGFESADAAKAAAAELQQLRDAKLTEAERQTQQIQELKGKAQKYDALQTRFASVVNAQLAQAPDRIRETIEAEAGEDTEERWRLMQAFAKAGVLQNGSTPAAPKPATTTPPGTPPAPVPPQTKREEWQKVGVTPGCEELGASSIAGQLFHQRNVNEIGEPTE